MKTLHQIIQEKRLAAAPEVEIVSENPWKLPPMKCPYCTKTFQSAWWLDHHVDAVHNSRA